MLLRCCDFFNHNLHLHFAGPSLEVPVTMNEMLLRGCMLKNTPVGDENGEGPAHS